MDENLTMMAKDLADCHDRISGLPEGLLRHILSFLDIKDAFRTSFVSRSWRNLWDSHPCLVFFDNFKRDKLEMVPFIDKVLPLYKGLTIRKFHADFSYKESHASSVDSWIQFALERNVQEFHLVLWFEHILLVENPPKMPPSLFNCRSLRVLELRRCDLNLHGPVCLNSLQALSLENVKIDDVTITALISGSPFLENLGIFLCDFPSGNLNIFDPNGQLRSLNIYFDNDTRANKIGIYARSLLTLELGGRFPEAGFHLKGLSSLTTATFDFSSMRNAEEYENYAELLQLLDDIRHAKEIKLCSFCVQVLGIWAKRNIRLPSFDALNLELRTFLYKWKLSDFAYLLRAFCHVGLLTIVIDPLQDIWFYSHAYNHEFDFRECWQLEELSFSGQFQHLKIVNVCGFMSCKRKSLEKHETELLDGILEHWGNEMEFMEFLLKTSKALERMFVGTPDREVRHRLTTKSLLLLTLSRKLLAFHSALPEAKLYLS